MPHPPDDPEVKDGVCQKQHGPILHIIKTLPSNQKNSVRHRCAGCAYRKGFQDGVEAAFKKLKEAAVGDIDAR